MSTKWIMKCLVQTWIPRNSIDLNKSVCAHYKMEAVLPGPIDWRPTPTQTPTPKNMTVALHNHIKKTNCSAAMAESKSYYPKLQTHPSKTMYYDKITIPMLYADIFFLYTFKYLDIKCPWSKNLHIVFTWENWYEQDGDYISSGYSVVIVLTPKDL